MYVQCTLVSFTKDQKLIGILGDDMERLGRGDGDGDRRLWS